VIVSVRALVSVVILVFVVVPARILRQRTGDYSHNCPHTCPSQDHCRNGKGSAITTIVTAIANATDAAVEYETAALLSPADAWALDDVSGKEDTDALEGVTDPAGADTAAAAP
jgi:hypothetical protein